MAHLQNKMKAAQVPYKDKGKTRLYGITNNERRLVLIGKTGSGKSATGNTLLGNEDFFDTSVGFESVTSLCKMGEALRCGKKVLVVDTPGLFDTETPNEFVKKEIGKCIGIVSPGPHALILILPIGTRFTEEERKAVEQLENLFGEIIYRYMIVLFTGKDKLKRHTLGDIVKKAPQDLKSVLDRSQHRYIAINNLASSQEEKEKDTKELLDIVDELVLKNDEPYYTNAMFLEAEQLMQNKMDELLKQEEKKMKTELKNIEKNIKAKYSSKLNAAIDEKNAVEKELESLLEQHKDLRAVVDENERRLKEMKMAEEEKWERYEANLKEEERFKAEVDEKLRRIQKAEHDEVKIHKDKLNEEQDQYRKVSEKYDKETDPEYLRKRARKDVEKGGYFKNLLNCSIL